MSKSNIKNFINKALNYDLSKLKSIEELKREFSKEADAPFFKNADIKDVYNEMLEKKEIQANTQFETLLKAKAIRTLSGVAIIAVLTKEFPCPGNCVFCPSQKEMPKSYLSNEPAVMRAILNKFDPYKQVQSRIKSLALNGHSCDKIELIVMGGTFSYLPEEYQFWFIKECFRAANDYPKFIKKEKSKDLKVLQEELNQEKEQNEITQNRIIGMTLETRPDYIDGNEIKKFRLLGATRVEIGVQSVFDKILEKNKRGHGIKETIEATKLMKNAGLKITYHLMPGLWGSDTKKDFEMFQEVYKNPAYQPDMVKIYPCVVTEDSELYELWKKGIYQATSNEKNKKLMIKIKEITPPYVRINRLIRDIPEESIVAGPNITNLRQIIQRSGVKCKCTRCREIKGNYSEKDEIILDRIDYPASDGKEIFLQFTNSDKKNLYAMLRLRIPAKKDLESPIFDCLKNASIVRELHTYGKMTDIGKKGKSSQHIGLGKKLLKEAEKISKEEFGISKVAVISGVGVRKYYEKNGYYLENEYMIKDL